MNECVCVCKSIDFPWGGCSLRKLTVFLCTFSVSRSKSQLIFSCSEKSLSQGGKEIISLRILSYLSWAWIPDMVQEFRKWAQLFVIGNSFFFFPLDLFWLGYHDWRLMASFILFFFCFHAGIFKLAWTLYQLPHESCLLQLPPSVSCPRLESLRDTLNAGQGWKCQVITGQKTDK